MNFENLIVEIEGKVAVVTLNRPQALNALNQALFADLTSFLDEVEKNDAIRVIILTGSGTKSFVAGADIKEFSSFNAEQGADLAFSKQEQIFSRIENFKRPVIAAINGFALGGGLELALASHIRIASDNAKLGLPEVTLGLIPGYGGTQRLPRLIGKGLANQAIFTAEMFDAQRALSIGLVNEVTTQEELLNRAKAIANKIAQNSSVAITKAIKAVNASISNEGFKVEAESFGELFEENDFLEGTTAFIEKRKPNFQ